MDKPLISADLNRDEQTLFELLITDYEDAANLYQQLQAHRKTAWVEFHSLQEYLNSEDVLMHQPDDSDIFLLLHFREDYDRWNLVELARTYPIERVLFKLWPNGKRLYFARPKGKASITGGELIPRDRASLFAQA